LKKGASVVTGLNCDYCDASGMAEKVPVLTSILDISQILMSFFQPFWHTYNNYIILSELVLSSKKSTKTFEFI
jgi:hypothetical protein